jgi:prephenate dehydrogenase
MSTKLSISSIGLVGFGAFGRLVANHLDPFFALVVNDPAMSTNDGRLPGRAVAGSAAEICRCDLIILAVPVSELANAIKCLRPHLRPGCTVVDVGSVKVKPARVMHWSVHVSFALGFA